MHKKIVLMNDSVGYGKVALFAMNPVLSRMGYELFNLPTALVSNTLDLGKYHILDTTEYMKNTLQVWEEIGFSFDAVSTGFVVSKAQTELLTSFCKKQSEKGALIFTDPIMADGGKLYNGMTGETVELMRKQIAVADYIVPNYTEACLLAGFDYRPEGASEQELREIAEALCTLGAKSVVITSAKIYGNSGQSVFGLDGKRGEFFRVDYEEIPARLPGTGDLFSAFLIGKVLDGSSLKTAATYAVTTMKKVIEWYMANGDGFKGIPVERFLDFPKQEETEQ